MRAFVVRVAAFVALQWLIGAALFGVYLSNLDRHVYLGAYADKTAELASAPGARLVFVGGSNVALGLDSETVAHTLPYRPANMGLITNIGHDMMLAQVEPSLREGDVVVLSLEYDRWFEDFDPFSVFQVVEKNPGAWRTVPPEYAPGLLDAAFAYYGQAARSVLGWGAEPRPFANLYRREGFNGFGDFTAHRDLPTQRHLATSLILDELTDVDLTEVVEELNDFHERAQARGVTMLVSFPPLPRDVYEERSVDLATLHDHLARELTIPLLDTPAEMAYPRHEFFDTIYHLNRQGVARRMDHLVPRLNRAVRGDPPTWFAERGSRAPDTTGAARSRRDLE